MTDPATPPDAEQLRYVEAQAELERILHDLESDTVDIDVLAEKVRRASTLIRWCRGRIAGARMEVESVVADLERLDEGVPGPG